MAGFLWWCCALSLASEPIVANRSWEVLGDSQTPRERLREAGRLLGERSITFAGRDLGQVDLTALGGTPEAEPLVRALREYLRQPVDLDDFLLFLDDVLASMQAGGFDRAAFRALLDLPDHLLPVSLLAVGRVPEGHVPGGKARKSLSDIPLRVGDDIR